MNNTFNSQSGLEKAVEMLSSKPNLIIDGHKIANEVNGDYVELSTDGDDIIKLKCFKRKEGASGFENEGELSIRIQGNENLQEVTNRTESFFEHRYVVGAGSLV